MKGQTPVKTHSVLGLCHVAGMLDMVALPVWIGTLMELYHLSPVQAGLTVTLFLAGAVLASAVTAQRFEHISHRPVVAAGFAVAAAAFGYLASLPVETASPTLLAAVHVVAGLAAGTALSVTHGTIGRTENPHRLFGLVNIALGVFGVAFFAIAPGLIHARGGYILFETFAAGMALAALVALIAFPATEEVSEARARLAPAMPASAWLIIFVVICLTFNQSLIFSFVERIGDHKGFTHAQVGLVLVMLGFVNLLPGGLAALSQNRLSPIGVGMAGPVLQAVLAMTMVNAANFAVYAVFAIPYVSIVIFTHTFLFGMLSRLDQSGRAVAATPAMMMSGAATGPAIGGAIVAAFGYEGLGYAAALVSAVAVALMVAFKTRAAAPAAVVGIA
jgi:MFS family permease